ncbi:cyclin H [Exophiala viscosa]|uniref:cyclin H n=1 Tax=Exophiala viscosa TaxID=2486360 RepID=UPI00219F6FD4|nr:cyclin H [Exophiala viscosa]
MESTMLMTSYGQAGAKVPGSRREKVRGYLRAANELRQIYQDTLSQKMQDSENEGPMPGDYPGDVARSGNEELVLFPSYARKHTQRSTTTADVGRYPPGTNESIEAPHSSGDSDYWKREWEKYEDANAIVDVDVRGWIYSPQSGPLNRKNRLLLAVARRLSGVYALPTSPTVSRASSQAPVDRVRIEDSPTSYEDELAAKEAENITRRGQLEAEAAVRGSYSTSDRGRHGLDSPAASRTSSPTRTNTNVSTDSEEYDPGIQSLKKRQSWNEPANMSREQMAAANELLLTRLKPFMSTPLVQSPVTVFFFNDDKSASKTVTTDDAGHFNLRAALDFVPSQVRVLASEKLSATSDVIITENKGVSLISDIDDTIKHSAIASGAREIFKNTFIRELSDLTIQGVKEWYTRLSSMGVKLHYVSNSPWQLYPLLLNYFKLAGLPLGSFHLKQYSGMLQGIFEPAAERKRGSINRLMKDFPDRKFILVGDSGEADLEVYTDLVLDYPRRILGVFIRDVTTPPKKGFFDQSLPNSLPDSLISAKDGSHLSRSPDIIDDSNKKPAMPTRPKPEHKAKSVPAPDEDLIDFTDEPEPKTGRRPSHVDDMRQLERNGKSQPPTKPAKPSSLRNFSSQSTSPTNHDRFTHSDTETQDSGKKKKKPPPPPAPRRGAIADQGKPTDLTMKPLSRPPFSSTRQNQTQPHLATSSTQKPAKPQMTRTDTSTSTASRDDAGYVASARRQIATAYNALPTIRSSSPSRPADQTGISGDVRPAPPPMRRGLSSYPAAAARWATGATGGDPAAGGDGGAPGGSYDKKLEIWKKRWARAEEIMNQRVGSDVMDECVQLSQPK